MTAFYVSNVESYLQRSGAWRWRIFCANVAALPLDAASVFVRPGPGRSMFRAMAEETAGCAAGPALR